MKVNFKKTMAAFAATAMCAFSGNVISASAAKRLNNTADFKNASTVSTSSAKVSGSLSGAKTITTTTAKTTIRKTTTSTTTTAKIIFTMTEPKMELRTKGSSTTSTTTTTTGVSIGTGSSGISIHGNYNDNFDHKGIEDRFDVQLKKDIAKDIRINISGKDVELSLGKETILQGHFNEDLGLDGRYTANDILNIDSRISSSKADALGRLGFGGHNFKDIVGGLISGGREGLDEMFGFGGKDAGGRPNVGNWNAYTTTTNYEGGLVCLTQEDGTGTCFTMGQGAIGKGGAYVTYDYDGCTFEGVTYSSVNVSNNTCTFTTEQGVTVTVKYPEHNDDDGDKKTGGTGTSGSNGGSDTNGGNNGGSDTNGDNKDNNTNGTDGSNDTQETGTKSSTDTTGKTTQTEASCGGGCPSNDIDGTGSRKNYSEEELAEMLETADNMTKYYYDEYQSSGGRTSNDGVYIPEVQSWITNSGSEPHFTPTISAEEFAHTMEVIENINRTPIIFID